ncbi:ABC transporter permease [Minwuia thermotolerans]|uniref:ABC transporter permease n=1 Tax=Minwuia thermotolerans TaxID=2056226 RepID=A0A2M9G613_9PROT|nr:ABC transporter permease [Minwuia thermotolerans]PJK31144.1 ABC transporter permease [Minwuia thermotolerans]
MSYTTVKEAGLVTADGRSLKSSLARAMFRKKVISIGLVLPLFAFIFFTFMLPIGDMLLRSVENDMVAEILPRSTEALEDWDETSGELPGEAAFEAMVLDLQEAKENRTNTKVGQRLNYERSGMSSLFRGSARKAQRIEEGPYKEKLIEADKDWANVATWQTIKMFSGPFTAGYFLSAIDAKPLPDGGIEFVDSQRAIYSKLFIRTVLLSTLITVLTLVLGFPVAYLIATQPARIGNLLIICVLLPFWTSLLVRTTSWIALLQQQGVLNDTFIFLGLISEDGRLAMIHNATGTVIAMTHILLPFMVLPLYSVMKTIPPSYMRAATSLGAHPWPAFWKVYFPNTVPGIGAGAILVFILAIGYYITPELVGGTDGTFISNRIAYNISVSLNWGLAAALGVILLGIVLAFYILYDKIVGIDNMKLG